MRFQRTPTAERIRELVTPAGRVVADAANCAGIGTEDRRRIDAICAALAEAGRALEAPEPAGGECVLERIRATIGEALHDLNARGIYLQGARRSAERAAPGSTSKRDADQEAAVLRIIRGTPAAA